MRFWVFLWKKRNISIKYYYYYYYNVHRRPKLDDVRKGFWSFPFPPRHLPRICHQVAYTPRWKPPMGLKMCQNAAPCGKGKKMAFSWKKLHKLAILCLNECPHTPQQQSSIAKLIKTCHLLFSTMGCSFLKYLWHWQRLHSVRWLVFKEVFRKTWAFQFNMESFQFINLMSMNLLFKQWLGPGVNQSLTSVTKTTVFFRNFCEIIEFSVYT